MYRSYTYTYIIANPHYYDILDLCLGISYDTLEADHTDLSLRAEEALAGHEAGQAARGVGDQKATNQRRAKGIFGKYASPLLVQHENTHRTLNIDKVPSRFWRHLVPTK